MSSDKISSCEEYARTRRDYEVACSFEEGDREGALKIVDLEQRKAAKLSMQERIALGRG